MANKILIQTKQINLSEVKDSGNSTQAVKTDGSNVSKQNQKEVAFKTKELKTYQFPLLADVRMEFRSEWDSITNMIPKGIMSIFNTMDKYLLGQTAGEGRLNLSAFMDVKRWSRTHPIRITFDLHFFTKTNPLEDVYNPTIEMVNLTIPSRDPENPERFILPGISTSTMRNTTVSAQGQKDLIYNSGKFISLEIPGVVYLPIAMVTNATPTFSKETTESGFPLWATVAMQVEGLGPATSDIFDRTRKNVTGSSIKKPTQSGRKV